MSTTPSSSVSEWKQLRLSLERPYKDDVGNRIPVLYDLTPEGERIYEPKETPSARLEHNLRRIFQERGSDFFERRGNLAKVEGEQGLPGESIQSGPNEGAPSSKIMTVEELYAMRMEIMPQLYIALGEMSHARDLLNSILSSPQPAVQEPQAEPLKLLSGTLVTKPAPIVSVQTFNAQLIIGSKDEALRKAASLFKSSAESMERSRLKGDKYWVDALRIRRANWALTPAPLPYGSPTGKGADKTSKDFLISYGLEGSPTLFRRRAIAQLTTLDGSSPDLVFPFHQRTRLRITTSATRTAVPEICVFDSVRNHDTSNLDDALRVAQAEVVDQEIFQLLVKEAGNLPTASAQVSERLIVIGAAQDLDLTFELVKLTVQEGVIRPLLVQAVEKTSVN
ncbi:unnamed protein product [Cyclocybe aegerita]|uniref:Mediator of RNA polymerase II transcription subunit 17 n=1 Tax=Cyclocybe aegerita TaxID=1973307 RepID=A0A8S0VWW2_CYCAE|nr:unnamed protein product [Cyclocybe aegerita]